MNVKERQVRRLGKNICDFVFKCESAIFVDMWCLFINKQRKKWTNNYIVNIRFV